MGDKMFKRKEGTKPPVKMMNHINIYDPEINVMQNGYQLRCCETHEVFCVEESLFVEYYKELDYEEEKEWLV